MSLQSWLSNGWLVTHQTGPQEIADLLAVADRDCPYQYDVGKKPGLIHRMSGASA